MHKIFDNDMCKPFMKPLAEWHEVAGRLMERTLQQNMALLNECISLGVSQYQAMAGVRKWEDAASLQMAFASEVGQKAVSYAKQIADSATENAHILQKWAEGVAHQSCCQKEECSDHSKHRK